MNRICVLVLLVVATTGILAAPITSSSRISSSSGSFDSNKKPRSLTDDEGLESSTILNSAEEEIDYDNIKIVRNSLKYLQTFGYATPDINVDDLAEEKIRELVKEPLIKFKEFFKLTPLDGTINKDVLKLMNTPRCADADRHDGEGSSRNKRFTRRGVPWKVEPVTMSIVQYTPQLNREQQDQVLHTCARIWTEVSGLKVTIKRSWAHLMVSFGPLDGPGNMIALGQIPSSDRLSTLKMDKDENWQLDNFHRTGAGPGLLWAVCHEMGHGLGLDHTRDRNQIMFPFSQKIGNKDHTLGADDIRGIQALYGLPSPNGVHLTNTVLGPTYVEQPRGPTTRPTTTTTPNPTTTTTPKPTTTRSTTTRTTTTPTPTTQTTTPVPRNLAAFRARFAQYLF